MPICTLAICLLRKMQQANGLHEVQRAACSSVLHQTGQLWMTYFRLESDHGGASPRKTQGSSWIGLWGI